MRNPWLKKNPLLSLWLSAANSAAGTARGQVANAVKRQTAAAVTKTTQDLFALWLPMPAGRPKPRQRRKTRR